MSHHTTQRENPLAHIASPIEQIVRAGIQWVVVHQRCRAQRAGIIAALCVKLDLSHCYLPSCHSLMKANAV